RQCTPRRCHSYLQSSSPGLSHSYCFLFLMIPRPPMPTLFPYTTLFRSGGRVHGGAVAEHDDGLLPHRPQQTPVAFRVGLRRIESDRKSTRLNSSHVKISYAVFCLKKKKKTSKQQTKRLKDP